MVALPLLAGVTAFLALTETLTIAAGVIGIRMSQALAIGIVVSAVLLAVAFAVRFRRPRQERETDPESRPARAGRWVDGGLGLVVVALLAWVTVVWLQLWVLAWYRSPLGWDELWYHIAAINEWTVRGGVGFHPLDPALAAVPHEVELAGWLNLPMGVELTGFLLYFLVGRSDRLIDAANLPWWPLAFAGLVVIAGQLGARGLWRWLAGALLVGVSLYVIESATLYVDAGFGSATIAAIAAGLVFALDREAPPFSSALLLGAAAGLMLGAKGSGAPYVVVLFGVIGATPLLTRRWREWRGQLLRLGLAAVLTLGVGGYWYLRNAIHTGNPIYPIQLQLGHKVLAPGYDLTGYDRLDWIVRPVLKPYPPWARTFVAWLQRDLPIFQPENGPNYAPAGGLGYVWLLGGLPAAVGLLIAAARRPRTDRAQRVWFLAVLLALLYVSTTIAWQARFTFWWHALGLPALAVVGSWAATGWRKRPAKLGIVVLVLGVTAVAVWESSATIQQEWTFNRELTSDRIRFQPAVDSLWPGLREAPGFRQMFAAGAIARGPWISTEGTLVTGILALPLERRVVVLPPQPEAARLRRLGEEGIEWVFWELEDGTALPATLTDRAKETYHYDRYGDHDFYLVRLAPVPDPWEQP